MNIINRIIESVHKQREQNVKDCDLLYELNEYEATILLYELADMSAPSMKPEDLKKAAREGKYSELENSMLHGCRLTVKKKKAFMPVRKAHVSIVEPEINREVVTNLEKMIEAAKAGEIQGIYFVVSYTGDETNHGYIRSDLNHVKVIGELFLLSHNLSEQQLQLDRGES